MNVEEIFSEAARITAPAGRAEFLDNACAGDSALRQRVESLLAAHEAAASFLESPAAEIPTKAPATFAPPRPISERLGTMVGRYKLLQQIGEGGMGVVYMAEQEKPVRRRVALKIIKPGMDSAQVIARFEAERQALAMMDHPNIARVLDAGTTDTGRPFFVMELVQGIPITKYCDDHQLTTQERLELFIPVCNAVQHAHQKGIIHRDIKPSNVLVMIYDSKPVPKIIDFGIAKALHQRLTEMTMFTQFGAAVGTLEYMSPEQAEMDAMGTDTRSDIYSLGVLLYELLTGSTPLDGKRLRALGYAEMLKTIREVDPPKPSTRLSRSAHDAPSISAKRQTEPRRLQKLVAGDLDWIVMKCLEKDRTRRYETANGLAMDIQRHLQDEAVTASPPGQLYKLQKLIRRNKLVFAAVGCVILALVVGLAASVWEAARAEREAARATAALEDLRAAAPSIAAEARDFADQEKFDEAIGKLDYAAQLRPDVPEYRMDKADLLETQLRLADAAAEYRAALKLNPGDARAKANAELCEQLAATPKGANGKLTSESLTRLDAQMANDHRPAAQIMPIARLLGDEKKYLVDYWLGRLKNLPVGTDTPLNQRLSAAKEGLLYLNLSNTQISDLSPLAGMPLDELDLTNCPNVVDLSPIRGLPLRRLFLNGTGVSSLEPLRGMNSLETLQIVGTPVNDLSPLQGLRIRWLNMMRCKVSSIAPLRGMPLEELKIDGTGVADLSPVAGMPLKTFYGSGISTEDFTPLAGLPLEDCMLMGTNVGDLSFLKGAPLKRLILWGCSRVRNLAVLSEIPTLEVLLLPPIRSDIPVEDFAAIEGLRNHPSLKQLALWITPATTLENLPSKDEFWKNWDRDYAWALRLRMAGFPLHWNRLEDGTSSLSLRDKSFSDLTILTGAAISRLDLNGSHVSELAPLGSMPLTWLELDNTPVYDLSPLRGQKLTYLGVKGTRVQDLSPLSGMPLTELDLRDSKITDVSPLAEVPTLVSVDLPARATNIESLRQLPNLRRLSFTFNQGPSCTSEDFWKTWDGRPWMRKLEAAGIAFDFDQRSDGYYEVIVHDPKFSDCSIFKGSKNIRRLDLEGSAVADLSPLEDLPLNALTLSETPITDLSPLRSPVLRDSLREIHLWKTRVTDFSPIAGCANLELFDVSDTQIADLSVVKGMKLQEIQISGTRVTDIALLAGMPLKTAVMTGTKIVDVSPLMQCPTLVNVGLPANARYVQSLQTLPNLDRISYTIAPGGVVDMTADQFWTVEGTQKETLWMTSLRNSTLTYKTRRLKDGSWQLILDDQPIADLSILKGAPITELEIARTPVDDLSPLRGMKLNSLMMSGTKVTDLAPLRGMPIFTMTIAGTDVTDLSPLAGMPLHSLSMTDCELITDISSLASLSGTLESLILPPNAKDIGFLRGFPKLRRLSYKFDPTIKAPSQTAKQFWSNYDHQQKVAASQPVSAATDQGVP